MVGLRTVPIFQKLSEAELQRLESAAKRERFPADKVIIFEGDRAESLYVILTGSVKVFRTRTDGQEKVVNTFGPGAFFGEFAMLDGSPRSASISTLEENETMTM